MASQYLSRLGIVLGIDSGELVQGIEDAKKQFHTFRTQVEKDTKAAAREFEILKNATEDYGKTLTKVEQIQREIERGRFQFASQNVKEKLLEQAKAYDAQAAAMKKTVGVLNEQQKLQVTYQLTDFFTQVASGQNAMIAFIQQGGQLKDSLGGVGNAIKAITSLFTPLRIAIGGVVGVVGALGYAFYSGMKEADDFNDSLTLTNRYAGITYDQFNTLSKQLSGDTNKSIGTVRESLMAVVASGQFTEKSIGAVTNAITTYASIAGISGKEAANKLMSAFDGTAAGVKRLNNEMNFLTLAQYKQIEALERANKKQEAAELGALAMNKMLETQRRELGYLEKSWENVKKAASSFWDWLKDIGRPEEASAAVSRLNKEIEGLQATLARQTGDSTYSRRVAQILAQKQAEKEAILENDRLLARSRTGVAGEKDAINLYDKAGGLQARLKLVEEGIKLETDAKFKARMAAATEEMQIEIELEQKIAQAKNEEAKKNQETFNQFTVESARIRAAKVAEAEAEAEKKRVEWRKKEQQKAFQADLQAFEKDTEVKWRLMDERNKIFADAENKLEAQSFAKEELDAKFSLIGATQKELDIAKARIEAQKELNQLMRSKEFAGMTSEDQEKAKQVYEQTLQAKIANIELAESLQRVQGMYDAVWSNMSSAIENFVRTGKLSIKDLTKSIIQDMLIMNMKLQAMTLIRGLLGSFMPSFSPVVSGDSALSSSSAAIMGRRAAGGPVAGGSTYLVGEQGPELFTPSGSGTIIPNNKMGQSAAVTNVTNNYINAIDAKSFEQRLLESNQAIWSANQYATKNMSTNFGRT